MLLIERTIFLPYVRDVHVAEAGRLAVGKRRHDLIAFDERRVGQDERIERRHRRTLADRTAVHVADVVLDRTLHAFVERRAGAHTPKLFETSAC